MGNYIIDLYYRIVGYENSVSCFLNKIIDNIKNLLYLYDKNKISLGIWDKLDDKLSNLYKSNTNILQNNIPRILNDRDITPSIDLGNNNATNLINGLLITLDTSSYSNFANT